jgi:hypothetical protein
MEEFFYRSTAEWVAIECSCITFNNSKILIRKGREGENQFTVNIKLDLAIFSSAFSLGQY